MLFIITEKTTFPREQIHQIIMAGIIGAVSGNDGIGEVDIAPVFWREGSTSGGDTVEQVSLQGIVGDLIDRIWFKVRELQDGVGIVDGPIGPSGRNRSLVRLGRSERFIGRVRVLGGRHC